MDVARTLAGQVVRESASSVSLEARRFSPPFQHPGLVPRHTVLRRLDEARPWTVLSAVAPAGSGKSILLGQWADAQPGPTAWVTLDRDDDDPTVLLTYLATALDQVTDVDPEVFAHLSVEYPPTMWIGRRLANLLTTTHQPFQLVLDDAHKVANPVCLDVLDLLMRHASRKAPLAIGSRSEVGTAIPRLRAEGRLVQIGRRELAMGPNEARALLDGVGAQLADEALSDLLAATDGWPVALYLAAQSLREGAGVDVTAPGRHPDIAAFVHAELLASLDDATVAFLLRSSVLDRMSGSSCDAVLRTFGSQERLEGFAESNLLVHPLDEAGTWFRYHDLFRDLLRDELGRREPGSVPELLRRAAHWHQVHGRLEEAVEYAMAAGDVDRAADLIARLTIPTYQAGRSTTLETWITWFEGHGTLEDHPAVALGGAWSAALLGNAAAAERRAAAADRARPRDDVPTGGGDHVDGQVALMHAMLCSEGMERARRDADRALRLLPPDHPWYPSLLAVRCVTQVTDDRHEAARATCTEAMAVCDEAGARPAQTIALAEAAVLAMADGDLTSAREHSRRALAVVEDHLLQDHVPSALAYAVGARLAARGGDPERTRELVARAQRLRPRLTHALPHLAVQTRISLARSLLSLSDVAGARTLLREIRDILHVRPGLDCLEREAATLRARVEGMPAGVAGEHSLTTAELRLLPLLRTHLTFREIGERLHLSPNTVKTQAISVYRKLGVSSRSEAVERAVGVGLLEAP